MKVFSAPNKVTLNITNRCNLECTYCSVSDSKNASGDLKLKEWKRVIDELAHMKVFNLLISGGEPFLRGDFINILKHISGYHFRFSINSNGTCLDPEVLYFLAGVNTFSHIQISLDGADSETHDTIRGRGSFDRITEGIGALRDYKIPFSFFVVVCKNNKERLNEIVLFSKEAGASMITFCSILPQGSALLHLDDIFLSFEERKEVEAELSRLKNLYPELVGGSLIEGVRQMEKISRISVPDKPPSAGKKITSCGGSVTSCSIRPEGWVIPCDRLWDYKVGNVRDESFQSIWLRSSGFEEFRNRYSRFISSFKECEKCIYSGVCSGGCPAIPYNMGKGIEGWDPSSCFLVYTGKKRGYI